MKPPPCTDTTSDEDMEACTLTLFLCNVPVHTWIVHSFAFSAPLREPHFSRDILSRQAAKGAKACILLRYPVLGRASCPPSKNDPTYLEKHHYHFEMPPPLGKSVEHYLWKGMKPFPALVPPALKHVRMKLFSGSR